MNQTLQLLLNLGYTLRALRLERLYRLFHGREIVEKRNGRVGVVFNVRLLDGMHLSSRQAGLYLAVDHIGGGFSLLPLADVVLL